MAVLVSEMTSNTASASLVVPVVLALAQASGIDPVKPSWQPPWRARSASCCRSRLRPMRWCLRPVA
jgi:hypothetical protein